MTHSVRSLRLLPLATVLLTLLPALARADGAAPEIITSPLGKPMTLKFHDEFDAVTDTDGQPYIDRKKWITTFWQGSNERTLGGNKEAQDYMDKDYAGKKELPGPVFNPFSFEKPGILTISATRVPEDLWAKYRMTPEHHFASGLLVSDGAFNFKYGYVEGRFKLPASRGAWPAFWMLGNDPSLGPKEAHQWPPEIDIFEFMGHWKKKFDSALIGRKGEKHDWTLKYHPDLPAPLAEDFHTWGVEWNEDEVAFIFDGEIWARQKTLESAKRPMYLLINLAVGGKWYSEEMTRSGTPTKPWEVDDASMPWKMECDYVRVYQP